MSRSSAVFRIPHNAAKQGQNNSFTHGEMVSLASTDWEAGDFIPRGFHSNVTGTLAITLCGSDTAMSVKVVEGSYYPYAVRKVTQASCSAPTQIANAIMMGY